MYSFLLQNLAVTAISLTAPSGILNESTHLHHLQFITFYSISYHPYSQSRRLFRAFSSICLICNTEENMYSMVEAKGRGVIVLRVGKEAVRQNEEWWKQTKCVCESVCLSDRESDTYQ